MTYRILLSAFLAALVCVPALPAADWITYPSTYSHDPETGERVTQYTPIGPFYTYARPDFMRSGYRHTRSSLQVGQSADHMHVVEEWGRPVRPYGEWRFPYRPYSVPYQLWGAPFAGLNQMPWGWGPTFPGGAQPEPYRDQLPPPYYDGSYFPYGDYPRIQPRGGYPAPGHPGGAPGAHPGHPGPAPPHSPSPGHGGGSA